MDLKAQSPAQASGGGAALGGGQRRFDHLPAATESQALKEAQNKYRLLEADYKTLHDKRLQDVSYSSKSH